HDLTILYCRCAAILLIYSIFVLISGANFALHFFASRETSLRYYFADAEFRCYFGWIIVGTLITVAYLAITNTYTAKDSLVIGFFNLASTLSTAGFAADFVAWPASLPFALFILAFMGGCASSTGGGMKMIRVLLLCKHAIREIHRMIFPNAVLTIMIGRINVSDRVVEAVW